MYIHTHTHTCIHTYICICVYTYIQARTKRLKLTHARTVDVQERVLSYYRICSLTIECVLLL